ncbi:hypothetical protein GCM10025791_45680 [Halioxenophilus aromaticivorans]|uniref:Uncharacterized protein n=1 Tax=Halioxenophilus aromaticivorans TaxID=1306992 RepID=A0AAV3U9A1_9ALTE
MPKAMAKATNPATTPWLRVVTNKPLRGLNRSDNTPKIGDNKNVGNNIPALATPTQNTVWVKSQASHPKLKRTIQLARVPRQEAKK